MKEPREEFGPAMSEEKPTLLNQINLVVKNVPESVAFYRRLGLRVEEAGQPEWVEHHATAIMPNGVRLEIDSEHFAEQWDRGWKGRGRGSMGVLFFTVPAREDVDLLHETLSFDGYPSQQPPYDAFWGARCAIVEDPDGNPVGIMSPINSALRRTPHPHP
jgi:catechol 2,3-dioxygenase-like lactoylglutathione lyase family enzyme